MMIEQNTSIVDLINEKPMTDSRKVAIVFRKRHDNVIRAIEKLDCSADFAKLNYEVCYENNALQNGKPLKYYRITKDGFTFLAMGFTGKEAARFKEDYINAFNRMQDFISQQGHDLVSQFVKTQLLYEQATMNASDAGRELVTLGKKVKPSLFGEMKKLKNKIQLSLPFFDGVA